MEGTTVNIKNLFYHLFLSWRLILIFALIFAILANCFGIYKDYTKENSAVKNDENITVSVEQIERAKSALTMAEVSDTDMAIELTKLYSQRIPELKEYLNNSVVMQINSAKVPTYSLCYYVDDHFVAEYPETNKKSYSVDIVEAYENSIANSDTIELVSIACEVEPAYAGEMLIVSDIREKYLEDENGNSDFNKNYVCIDVIGRNEAECERVAEIIKIRMKELGRHFASIFPDYDITIVSEGYEERTYPTIYQSQVKLLKDIREETRGRLELKNALNENQKKYYSAVLEYEELMQDEDDSLITDKPSSAKETKKISYVHKKLIVIGFLVGLVLAIGIIVLVYVLTPVIRVRESLSVDFEQTVLGTIWIDPNRKKLIGALDRAITRWFYGRESTFDLNKRLEMICAGIDILIDKEELKTIYITGADCESEVVEGIKEKLQGKVSVKSGESIVFDPGSLKEMSESESVLFVETAGDSRYEEVAKELELAEQSKVKILGFVLVQN